MTDEERAAGAAGEGTREPANTVERQTVENVEQAYPPTGGVSGIADSSEVRALRLGFISWARELVKSLLPLADRFEDLLSGINFGELTDVVRVIAELRSLPADADGEVVVRKVLELGHELADVSATDRDDALMRGVERMLEEPTLMALVAALAERLRRHVAPAAMTADSISQVAAGDEVETLMAKGAIDIGTLLMILKMILELFGVFGRPARAA